MIPLGPLAPYANAIKYGAIAIAIGYFGISCVGYGKRAGAIEVAQLKAEHAEYKAKLENERSVMLETYRNKEAEAAQAMATLDAYWLAKVEDAKNEASNAVIADVRAGRLRLRYPTCPKLPATAKTPASPSVDTGETDSGEAIAGAIVGIGRESDTRLEACQAIIRQDRESMQ